MDSVRILKTEMSVTNIDNVVEKLIFGDEISVAICNSNTLVRCYKDKELNKIVSSFDIKCTDGFPVAKASKSCIKIIKEEWMVINYFYKQLRKA